MKPPFLTLHSTSTRLPWTQTCVTPVLFFLSCLGVSCGGPQNEPSTLILRSGIIHTMDEAGTTVEAMAIRDQQIVYVGDNEGSTAFEGEGTEVIELAGKVVLPGFHDAHTHPIWSGADLLNVDLFETTTVEELQDAVKAWADDHPEAEWVLGGGWNMSDFDGLLNKVQLDEVVPDRPVLLYSSDGHTAFVSSLALELAGIDRNTEDPEDGRIEHDEAGEPTGILQESAMDLVSDLAPQYPDAQWDEGLVNALVEANAYGITTVVDAYVWEEALAGYARAEAAGTLTVRVHGAALVEPGDPENTNRIEALRAKYTSDRVRVDAAKFFVDGIIEAQTAYMLEPYTDGSNAEPAFSDEELQSAAIALDAAGIQLHAHAIGDGAVRQFLDALEAVAAANGERDRRALLAHIEVVDPDDVPRFAELDAYADFQPLWAYPDEYIQDLTWPVIGEERSESLYPIGALHDAGATIVAGSDWSVSSMNPFEAIEVAVTRQDPWEDEGEVLTPQHRIDVMTALRAYTSSGAKASFSEETSGSLEVGKKADFILVDQDPLSVDSYALSDIVVLETWLDGERVYSVEDARVSAQSRAAHAGTHARHRSLTRKCPGEAIRR